MATSRRHFSYHYYLSTEMIFKSVAISVLENSPLASFNNSYTYPLITRTNMSQY